MKIKNIYIGGWFQRTMLQLSEIYDFLRGKGSKLALEPTVLNNNLKNLDIVDLNYKISGEEYITILTGNNISIKIFEDGLIVLKTKKDTKTTMKADIKKLTDYYEKKFSKAINYLFSLGAPVPKELAKIETIYPYFIVCENASKTEMTELLKQASEEQKYYTFSNKKYEVMRGDKYYFINNFLKADSLIERYIEEEIFIREFKGQMHRYLNIHRIIWEKIDQVKEQETIKGAEILKFATKVESYAKTINLIDGRIKQMATYLPTRESIAKNDAELIEFLNISGYKYETLKDTLNYIQYLWNMTKEYVQSAQKLFAGLKADVTSKSISNLTIVTSVTAGATLLGLFTKSAPTLSVHGLIYCGILVLIGWGANRLLKLISRNRKYKISDINFDNNIQFDKKAKKIAQQEEKVKNKKEA